MTVFACHYPGAEEGDAQGSTALTTHGRNIRKLVEMAFKHVETTLFGRKHFMKVKELMIPVADYQTLGKDACLGEVAAALKASKHRDILVVDDNGSFVGVLTMTDVIMAL